MKGLWDPEISVPLSLDADTNYILSLTVKTTNASPLLRIRWKTDGRTRFFRTMEVPLSPDTQWHTYKFDLRSIQDLSGKRLWSGHASKITLTFFGFSDTIEISELSIAAPGGFTDAVSSGWQSFLTPSAITPLSINHTPTPYIFQLPFVFLLNCLLVLCVLIISICCFIRRSPEGRRNKFSFSARRPAIVLAVIIIVWLAFDLRHIYDQAYSVRTIKSAFTAKAERGKFYNLNDFYGFSDFVKQTLPKGTKSFKFHQPPGSPLSLQMKYRLYPTRSLSPDSPVPKKAIYHVVYKSPGVMAPPGGLLYRGRKIIAHGTLVGKYDDYSFIFKETQTEQGQKP